ncbi:peptidylprolyl isomerase [Candidatus Flexifilum breve]|uniref:peptidylprolyl isomerase n=1 Tax=Candidatus Flexifilum breve TaxID=3140694 RepID=UPI0031CC5F5C
MKNMIRLALLALVVGALMVGTVAAQDAQTPTEICAAATPATDPANREFAQAEQVLEAGVDYRAVFCTGAGAVYIDLLENESPITVNSFVFLAQQGYYNNTTFHRVIQDFMAQGGDPTATGTGGPGYQFVNENTGYLTFDRAGWLAMANAGPNTNGSQFFITTVPYPSLDFGYTIFGEVLEGQESVEGIELRDPAAATTPGTSLDTVVIVTDPASVTTTYVAPEPATQDEVLAVIEELRGMLPPTLAIDEETTGVFTAEQVVATAPEAVRAEYADLLSANNFEYRVSNRITNATCATNIQFWALAYSLDRFATPEEAAAAIASGTLGRIATEAGFTETASETLPNPVFTQNRTVCETDSVDALTFWQRGHFVVTVRATFPAQTDATTEQWLAERVGIATYERIFADVLRREMR